MNIGFAALAVFALLAPGFGLVTGMRAFSRFDIKTGRQSHTAEIIMLLLLASLIHILIYPFYQKIVLQLFSFNLWDFFKTYKVPAVGQSVDLRAWVFLFFYVPFSSFSSVILGFFAIKAIENKIVPISMFHGAMYKIISKNPIIYCSILTNIKHENCFLMYRGILPEISYSAGYKIDYVCLDFVEKYLAEIRPNRRDIVTGGRKSPVTYEADPDNELFVINESQIANILFTKKYNVINKEESTLLQRMLIALTFAMATYCFIKLLVPNLNLPWFF